MKKLLIVLGLIFMLAGNADAGIFDGIFGDTSGSGVTDGDKGDVAISGGGTVYTVENLGTLGTKNPPIDADKAVYRDSTASDALVTSTWTQIKAFLKTYYDSLYAAINADTTGSAGSLKSPATTGKTTITGPGAGTTRAKTVRDADDTFIELGTTLGAFTGSTIADNATTQGSLQALETAVESKQAAMGADDNYVTDAQLVVIGNTSGTNSGNETTATIGTLINGATAKTVPVDADYFGLMDSEATNILKKLSWAYVKSLLWASPQITGLPTVSNGATSAGYMDFKEDSDNGTNRVRLIGPASTADVEVTLPAATDTLVGKATTDDFTNKTFNANGTGNVLKGYGYITFTKPHNRGSATGAVGTTETTNKYGVPSFADDAETNNFVDYIGEVPRDIDTAVDLVAWFKFILGGADTADHDYIVSMVSIADSAAAAGTPGNPINLTYTADGSGADGDIETAGGDTLTDWKSNVTAGALWLIRVTRDGDDGTNDASTVDSYPLELTIRYGFTQ